MTRRNWKRVRPTSLIEALRLCKEYAHERRNLSIERIADRMGVTHDSLYKWLAGGRLPAILIPAYELACGCSFVSEWLAASAGKLVIDMPTGRKCGTEDLLTVNSGCAAALQLLTAFYADPASADTDATLSALRGHLEQVAYHHQNVARYAAPELEFGA
jgi:transcriptional regulator with XRE-family HTH domain